MRRRAQVWLPLASFFAMAPVAITLFGHTFLAAVTATAVGMLVAVGVRLVLRSRAPQNAGKDEGQNGPVSGSTLSHGPDSDATP
jgi:hypothetical protein